MNNGRLDRALLLAILAALGGLYWQMFSMKGDIADQRVELSADIADVRVELSADIAEVDQRLSADIANSNQRLSADIADLSERLIRVETLLEYIVQRLADLPPDQSPED